MLRLRQERELPEPEVPGFKLVDRSAWRREIDPTYEKRRKLLHALEEQKSEKGFLCDERMAELKDLQAALGKARRLVKASYEFGGCDERASKGLLSYLRASPQEPPGTPAARGAEAQTAGARRAVLLERPG